MLKTDPRSMLLMNDAKYIILYRPKSRRASTKRLTGVIEFFGSYFVYYLFRDKLYFKDKILILKNSKKTPVNISWLTLC